MILYIPCNQILYNLILFFLSLSAVDFLLCVIRRKTAGKFGVFPLFLLLLSLKILDYFLIFNPFSAIKMKYLIIKNNFMVIYFFLSKFVNFKDIILLT